MKRIDSRELGIDLKSGKEAELFKWFLACLLFGKPIQQEVAKRTYLEFEKSGLTDPDEILKAGWDRLVSVLDAGHYVRFDFSTADKLLEVCRELKERYGGVGQLLKEKSLGPKLLAFRGIGPVTARIFRRDIRKYARRSV